MTNAVAHLEGRTFTHGPVTAHLVNPHAEGNEFTVSLILMQDGRDVTASADRIVDAKMSLDTGLPVGFRIPMNPITFRDPPRFDDEYLLYHLDDTLTVLGL